MRVMVWGCWRVYDLLDAGRHWIADVAIKRLGSRGASVPPPADSLALKFILSRSAQLDALLGPPAPPSASAVPVPAPGSGDAASTAAPGQGTLH